MDKQVFIRTALASVLALGTLAAHAGPAAPQPDKDKCFGVAKAGANDCASASGSALVRAHRHQRQRQGRREVRRQGHLREDGRLDDGAEEVIPRRPHPHEGQA